MERIVLLRKFGHDLTDEHIRELASDPMGCRETYRVTPIRSYLTADKRTLVCIFEAPDAEAVRAIGKDSPGMIAIEVFPVSEHLPAPPAQ